MDQVKIGSFIATLRREKSFTQKDVAAKLEISEKTVSKWECGNGLPEVTFMIPLCNLLGITVNELLTGERVSLSEYVQKAEGTMIELAKEIETSNLKNRITRLYGMEIDSVDVSDYGAGSITYFVKSKGQTYVVKYPSENSMNHPEDEPILCAFLLKQGIPVCEFIPNLQGNMISRDESGRLFHVQKFFEGKVYDYQEAPSWMMESQATMLGKIHRVLAEYQGLPNGIGEDFFKYMTPQNATNAYEKSLALAKQNGDKGIEEDLCYRIERMKSFPEYHFELDKLTRQATHGDYMITQLICGENRINAVIDWTTACVHPIIWEIMRSYIYASPSCKKGEIDIDDFIKYVKIYLQNGQLNSYDISMLGKLFYYQISVCDYYGQYYGSITNNRKIYLEQAILSTKMMKWFDQNIEEFTQRLVEEINK